MPDPTAILDFWFGKLEDGLAGADYEQRWFSPDSEFDQQCKRFQHLLEAASTGDLDDWRNSNRDTLAFIVLCDQLPRNIFRGTAQAFAWDHLALDAALAGIKQGFDTTLGWDERCFFYMPFEHSEDILWQHTAVGLFTSLRDDSPSHLRSRTGNYLRFAQQHRDIIQRFDRFPHRNKVLGRTSSDAEAAFVAAGDGFGQNR